MVTGFWHLDSSYARKLAAQETEPEQLRIPNSLTQAAVGHLPSRFDESLEPFEFLTVALAGRLSDIRDFSLHLFSPL